MPPGKELPLFISPRLRCPWCGEWNHKESYIALQTPPGFEEVVTQIYKCPETGCKMLFAYDTLSRK